MNHVDQLVGGVGTRAGRDPAKHVLAHVILEHLGEQAVDGAARGRQQVHDFGAVRITLEGAFDGFDLAIGASTPDVLEAQLNGLMMQVSREVNIVADSSKLGRRSVSRIGPLERIHRLITDGHAPQEFVEALRKKGVEVLMA